MRMTLYEIDKGIEALLDQGFSVDEETGEVLDPTDLLEELQMARAEKIEAVAVYIKSLDAMAENLEKETNVLRARKKAIADKSERIKRYLSFSMEKAGEAKFEGVRATVKFTNSKAVVIDDLATIDKKYIKAKTEESADKVAIKKAITSGETVEGAHIEDRRSIKIG